MKKFKNLVFFVTILTMINFSCKKDNASPQIIVTPPPPVLGDTIPNLLLGKWNLILQNDTATTNYGSWVLIKQYGTFFLSGSYSTFQSDGTYFENLMVLDSSGVLHTRTATFYFTVKGNEFDMYNSKNAPLNNRYFIVKLTNSDFIIYQTETFSSTSLKDWLFWTR
jgi:hypothetical protein